MTVEMVTETPGYDLEKGYDPSIPLEERTPEEKQATTAALNRAAAESRKRTESRAKAPKAKAESKRPAVRDVIAIAEKTLEKADGPMHTQEIKAKANLTDAEDRRLYLLLKQHPDFVRTDPKKPVYDLKKLNPEGLPYRPNSKSEEKWKAAQEAEAKPAAKPKAKAKTKAKAKIVPEAAIDKHPVRQREEALAGK